MIDYTKPPSEKKEYNGEDVQKFYETQGIKPSGREKKKGSWVYKFEKIEENDDGEKGDKGDKGKKDE